MQDLVDPRAPDPRDHLLVAQQRVQRARRLQQRAELGRVGPRLRAERAQLLVGLDRLGAQQLDPRGLLGAELAQAQLAVSGQPPQHARGAVLHRAALVEQLQPPGAHQVREERQRLAGGRVEVEQQQLAAPAHAGERAAVGVVQRRVERLEHVQARRHDRLDRQPRERLAEPAGGDLHLGQLGHPFEPSSLAGHGRMGAGGGGRDRAARGARARGAGGRLLAVGRRARRRGVRVGVRRAAARRGADRAHPVLEPGPRARPARAPDRHGQQADPAARPPRHGRRARRAPAAHARGREARRLGQRRHEGRRRALARRDAGARPPPAGLRRGRAAGRLRRGVAQGPARARASASPAGTRACASRAASARPTATTAWSCAARRPARSRSPRTGARRTRAPRRTAAATRCSRSAWPPARSPSATTPTARRT